MAERRYGDLRLVMNATSYLFSGRPEMVGSPARMPSCLELGGEQLARLIEFMPLFQEVEGPA